MPLPGGFSTQRTARFSVLCRPGETQPAPAAAAAPAPAPAPAPAAGGADVAALQARVAELGNAIREAKAGGASKQDIKPQVDALLAAKAELAAASGGSGASGSGGKKGRRGDGAEEQKAEAGAGSGGQKVTPWEVEAGEEGVDYDKLIRDFGCTAIDQTLLDRIEAATGRPCHHWLRRGLFFSHQDLEVILALYEEGKKFFLYTGRGPSSDALHMGHLIPFHFTKYLQDAFDCPLVIQLTDDEKFLWKGGGKGKGLDHFRELAVQNCKDIIACGFDVEKTFIFQNTEYMGTMYPTVVNIQQRVTTSQARGIFGFDTSANIGKVAFPAIQAAPCFSTSFPVVLRGLPNMPCLVPCAIDQAPYFRMARDVAPRMKARKCSLIYSKFFPALQGAKSKMSSSTDSSAIFVSDTPKQIAKKVNKYALSGGGETVEEHRANGANLEVDVPFAWLTFFMEDDERLAEIEREYGAGRMMTGEVKQELIAILQRMVADHQAARAAVTDELVAEFMRPRELSF